MFEQDDFEFEDDPLEAKNQKFQNACRIWFCPAEDRIAKELRQMTPKEREKVWADLSGNEKTSQFRKEIVEEPNMISKELEEMRKELSRIREKPAFDKACEKNRELT